MSWELEVVAVTAETLHLGGVGMVISLVVPAAVWVSRGWIGWRRIGLPAVVSAPVFVVVHALYSVLVIVNLPVVSAILVEVAVVLAAAVFWLPVVGPRPCGELAQSAYLFLTLPFLDMAAVYVIIRGHVGGGLAMIVGMLPFGVAAVVTTVRWITTEERSERLIERAATAGDLATRQQVLQQTLRWWGGDEAAGQAGPNHHSRPH